MTPGKASHLSLDDLIVVKRIFDLSTEQRKSVTSSATLHLNSSKRLNNLQSTSVHCCVHTSVFINPCNAKFESQQILTFRFYFTKIVTTMFALISAKVDKENYKYT